MFQKRKMSICGKQCDAIQSYFTDLEGKKGGV